MLTPPRAPRFASLDHWRGVACLFVLIHHAAAKSVYPGILEAIGARLWIGVPVFFVISGYCISAAADSHRRRSNSFRSFMYRRVRRIFPPYWAALFGTALCFAAMDVVIPGRP